MTDEDPYCRECGHDKLAYIEQNAECRVWKCKACGKTQQTFVKKNSPAQATDTDRTAQMAREAGIYPANPDTVEMLARFARLVAEDCAGIVDSADTPDGWSNSHISDAIRARYK